MKIKSFAEVLKVTAENSQVSVVKIRDGDAILQAGKISHLSCKANLEI